MGCEVALLSNPGTFSLKPFKVRVPVLEEQIGHQCEKVTLGNSYSPRLGLPHLIHRRGGELDRHLSPQAHASGERQGMLRVLPKVDGPVARGRCWRGARSYRHSLTSLRFTHLQLAEVL